MRGALLSATFPSNFFPHGYPHGRRRIEMETRLSQLHTPDAKEREIRKYSKTESQHLRLRRTKIKLTDFVTVKVIGKGAFGEVSLLLRRVADHP